MLESKRRVIETLTQNNNDLNNLMEAHSKEFTCIPNPVPVSYSPTEHTSANQPSSSTQDPVDPNPVEPGTGIFASSVVAPSFQDEINPFGILDSDSESSDNITTQITDDREISEKLEDTDLIEKTDNPTIISKDIPSENKIKLGRKSKGKYVVK